MADDAGVRRLLTSYQYEIEPTESGEHFILNGLHFKRRFESMQPRGRDKAGQEFQAVQFARILLPVDIAPPQAWGAIDRWFVSEQINAPKLDREAEVQCRIGAEYLAYLHTAPRPRETIDELRSRGLEHYSGIPLRNRIAEEARKADKAFPKTAEAVALQNLVDDLVHDLHEWNDEGDMVLGHGDFQAKNIFIVGERAVPIDWIDFGVCSRAYEVAHYLHSISPNHRGVALDRYLEVTGIEGGAWLEFGQALDGIIRAGSQARRVCDQGVASSADIQRRFHDHVRRASDAHGRLYRTG